MTNRQKASAGVAAAVIMGAAAGVGIITSYEPGEHPATMAATTGCCYDPTTQTSRQPLPMMGEGPGRCIQTATQPWEWRDPCPNVGTITLPTPTPVWDDPEPTPPPGTTPVPTPAPTAVPTPWIGGTRPLTPYDRVIVVGCAVEGQCWMSTTDPDGRLRFYGPWTATIELRQ